MDPSPCASHAGAKALAGLTLHASGWGISFGREGILGLRGPCGSVRPVPVPTCPHHLPQEHKAEVKASMTASFPAVGAAGARALTHGTRHGSSAQTQGHAHQLGQTGHMEPGPHPQLAVCLSVCPPVCHNPEQPQCWVPVGQGWAPCRRISLAKPKAPSRSLKGGGLGAARQQALGPEDGQAQASLSISGPQ